MNAEREHMQSAWLTPDWDVPAHVHAISTLRAGGGVSRDAYASLNLALHVGDDPAHVRANRAWLREVTQLPQEPLWLEQVHGIDVAVNAASGSIDAVPPRADAAVAFEPGRVCVVMTADCL